MSFVQKWASTFWFPDFTSDSVAVIKVERNKGAKEKVKCMKSLDETYSLLIGTGTGTGSDKDSVDKDKGLIELYRVM